MNKKNTTYRITDLAESDRPRERLARLGPGSLTTAELLAILLRVGVSGENAVQVANRLLLTFNGIAGLHKASFDEVCTQHGIGPAKAAQIKAALELGNRMVFELPDSKPAVNSPKDAADLVMFSMSVLEQEELWVVLLDTRNRVMQVETVYKGSLNSSQIRIGELFKTAIRRNAAALIVIHNHPSGDKNPSPEDVRVTRAIYDAGQLLDIELLDHLIIAGMSFVSLKERGLGFG